MKFSTLFVTGAGLLAMASSFASAHFDFVPKIVAGQIATGGHDDEAGVDVSSLVVGGFDFGETPEDPYNIGDPGFNTIGASSFTGSSTLRLSAVSYNGSFLSYWDGTGTPSFSAAPSNVLLKLAGSPTRAVSLTASAATYAPSSPSSLLIGTFTGAGAMHVHLTSSIFFNNDQVADSVPVGAYLMSFTLANPGTGIVDSAPLYIIYNNGLTEEQHDLAISTLASSTASVVPEPAALGLLTPALALLTRRRR